MSIRAVKKLITAKPTLEGAGVHLRRAFGFGQTSDYDPFLLLDDFRNDVPADYLAGFPWHPHRGIETITYVLAGHGRAWRQPWKPGRHCRRRHPMDDGRQRHHPSGDAEGRSDRPDARLSAVGESSCGAQDDSASLSRSEDGGYPRNHRR
jgi:Pirin